MNSSFGTQLVTEEFFGKPTRCFQPLKRLHPKHLRIIALHMQGFKGTEIWEMLTTAGMSISLVRIYAVINDPLSTKLMQQFYAGSEVELKALEGMAVDSLRFAMRDGSHRDALSAADKVFKLNKRYGAESSRDSAENVIGRAMAAALAANNAVKEVVRSRPRLTDITPENVIDNNDDLMVPSGG